MVKDINHKLRIIAINEKEFKDELHEDISSSPMFIEDGGMIIGVYTDGNTDDVKAATIEISYMFEAL